MILTVARMVSLIVQETLTSICSHRLAYSFIKIILCDVEGKDGHSPFIFFTYIFLALLLSCFSRVRLCAAPETAAHQAPPFPGFSRQEHWSGLPFPSPMHESEKRKVKVKSLSSVRLLVTPWTAAYQPPPFMEFSRQEY